MLTDAAPPLTKSPKMSKRSAKLADLDASVDDEVLVPQTPPRQTGWRTPPASPSPEYVPSSPVAARPDDRITSSSSISVAAASIVSSPRADADPIILFLVGEASRVENRMVGVYRSRADALGLRTEWWDFMHRDGQTIGHGTTNYTSLLTSFARLSCAHPRIADADARAWLRAEPFIVPYRYALPPELDTPLSITAVVYIHLHE
jgi:hypothetical protein